jgi:hypothetical protein
MGAWYLVVLAGASGVAGCGSSADAPRADAAPDAPISSGGAIGAGGGYGTGGVGTGGITSTSAGGGGSPGRGGSPGTGGLPSTGGTPAPGGIDGSQGDVLLVAGYDGQVHATWQNQTRQSIFLAGCGTVQWSRLEGTTWVNHGGFVVCGWEGTAVEVAPGASYTETQSFARAESGRYRVSGQYGVGCTPGLGLSSAGCASFFTATSNEFVVSATAGTGGTGTGGAAGSGRGGAAGGGGAGGATGGSTGSTGGAGGTTATAIDGGAADGASGCINVCALYGEACCVWTDPCLGPAQSCTFDVLAASVGTTYQYQDLEAKVAALPADLSASFTDQDIAWAAADPSPAGRIELHLTDAAAARYGKILDGANDGRVFRVSCGSRSLFVGVFYLIYGAAALDTPVLHEAREDDILVLRLGAQQGAWMGMGVSQPETAPLRERIDRPELRAAFCRRGIMHVLDPNARPANP